MEVYTNGSSSHHSEYFGSRPRPGSRSLNLSDINSLHHGQSEEHDGHQSLPEDPSDRFDEEDDTSLAPFNRRSKALASSSNRSRDALKITVLQQQQQISYLERQLASYQTNDATVKSPPADGDMTQQEYETGDANVSDAIINHPDHGLSAYTNVVPEIIEKPWTDFMNKQADEDKEYAIEVLKGDPTYYNPSKMSEKPAKQSNVASKEANAVADCVRKTLHCPTTSNDELSCMPDRIRIISPYILSTLAGIDKHIDAIGPVVMLRPFKFLYHHKRGIEEAEVLLQRRVDEDPDSDDMSTVHKTLLHIQCLLLFMTTYMNPSISRFLNGTATKIAFRDLWYIFPPGEDIFMPLRRLRGAAFRDAMDATPDTFLRRYNMLWRVVGAGCGRPDLSAPQNHETILKPSPFKVNCYYVDFDGKFFVPTIHEFAILPYHGEKEITSLDFHPVRFIKDGQSRVLDHTEQGQKTFAAIAKGFTHFYYAGLTMVTQPCGCSLHDENLHQEWIESEVVVDFKAALLRNPSWRPRTTLWRQPPRDDGEIHERCPVRYWKDKTRMQLENSEHEYVYDDYHIDKERSVIFRNQEPLFSPIPSGWASNAEMVPKKDVGLLAGRAFAFVLRTRSFAPLWLWALQPIEKQSYSLDNLQLRHDEFKQTIYALVESHFRQISQQTSDYEYDIVKGKGKGLVILLHGAPGVGKTSTAESVAAKSGRPLFQITSGDLGLSPGEVERNLKEIFRFAQLWGCVLLLDECDVFLVQRAKNDVKRSGLVSVFLRALEFFTGVLFLTTNRVGVLDDAIKSRLTWTAYYPPLDEGQTMRIWQVNLRLLKERSHNLDIDYRDILRFALTHYRTAAATESTWNGRQIQTAFKVAAALAEWDLHSQNKRQQEEYDIGPLEGIPPAKPKLTAEHFKVIAQGTEDFENYMRATTGLNERERAYNAMERADDFDILGRTETASYQEEPRITLPGGPVTAAHRKYSSTYQQQNHDRSSPLPQPPSTSGRRRSSVKFHPEASPSASMSNLNTDVQRQKGRRYSSSLSTVVPSPESQMHSTQPPNWLSKPNSSYSRGLDDYSPRRAIRDNTYEDYNFDEARNGNAIMPDTEDSESSLDKYDNF